MAGEYGVNIKITANTSKLDLINKKANQLASAVDKVNSINLRAKFYYFAKFCSKCINTKEEL